MAEHDGQLNHSSDSAPAFLAGFDPRQIRPRLPPGPALARGAFGPDDLPLADRPGGPHPLAGAAGLLASGLGMAPCLRACALRQSDRENAPQERFQSVLWARSFQPGRAVSQKIFAHCLRLAPDYANTCATQECDAMFPPIIIKHLGLSRARSGA
jgi:hypothetical protein